MTWLLGLACFLGTISFYYLPGVPTAPNPATGNVYPINNHGYVTYLNHRQWVIRNALTTAGVILGATFLILLSKAHLKDKDV